MKIEYYNLYTKINFHNITLHGNNLHQLLQSQNPILKKCITITKKKAQFLYFLILFNVH
jgi:hypothetical protein